VVSILLGSADAIIDEAVKALGRSHLTHHERAGLEEDRTRLQDLFTVVVDCIRDRQLAPTARYAEALAHHRQAGGFDIGEVQVAFNVLEEAMWRRIAALAPPDQLAEAIGLLTTVLGAGKDVLARTYVALRADQRVPSLDLSALFAGT